MIRNRYLRGRLMPEAEIEAAGAANVWALRMPAMGTRVPLILRHSTVRVCNTGTGKSKRRPSRGISSSNRFIPFSALLQVHYSMQPETRL